MPDLLSGIVRGDQIPPPQPSGLVITDEGVNVPWGGYDYFIDRNRLRTQGDLLAWAYHLAAKTWADGWLIHCFIGEVSRAYGIKVNHSV